MFKPLNELDFLSLAAESTLTDTCSLKEPTGSPPPCDPQGPQGERKAQVNVAAITNMKIYWWDPFLLVWLPLGHMVVLYVSCAGLGYGNSTLSVW